MTLASVPPWLPRGRGVRRTLIAAGVLLGLLALYALAGYYLLPTFGRAPLERALGQALGGPVRIGALTLDPFRLRASASAVTVADAQGREWLRVDALSADLCACSAWRRRWVVEGVTADAPVLALERDRSGRIVLPLPEREEAEPGEPPPFELRAVELRRGRIAFVDRSVSPPLELELHAIEITGSSFASGDAAAGPVQLSATLPDDGRLRARGTLHPAPLRAELDVELRGVDVTRYAAYLPPGPRTALAGGRGSLRAQLRYTDAGLAVRNGTLALAHLRVTDAGGRELFGAATAQAEGVAVELRARRVSVGAVRVDGAHADVRRTADGTLDLLDALAPAAASKREADSSESSPQQATPEAAAADNRPGGHVGAPNAWRIQVGEATLAADALRFTDAAVDPPFDLRVATLTLDARDYDSADEAPLRVSLRAQLEDGGALELDGALATAPLGLTAQLTAQNLPVALAQPYLAAAAHLALHDGRAAAKGELSWRAAEPTATRYAGTLTVESLELHDTRDDERLLAWERLHAREVVATPQSVETGRVFLRAPYFRYRILAGGTSNLHGLARAPEPGREDAAAAPPSEDTAEADGAGRNAAPQVRVAQLTVRGGTLDFADRTLTPNFAVAVEQLGGTARALTNEPGTTTRVALEGRVDGYAPARVEAAVTPGRDTVQAQLALRFRDLEMSTFSPYAGKFAGYRIRRGTLDLDLEYAVEDRQLTGRNRIVLDQLELGERVDSPTATSLPVGLAIALLRDSRGVIDLDLPVRGDLSDPQFDYRALIGRALGSAVRKIVSAPFTFLGKLLGGKKPPQSVVFAPGEGALAPRQAEALGRLAEALAQRPVLRVVVSGAAGRSDDARALAEQRLAAALAGVDEGDPWERLKSLYRERYERDPEDDLPEPPEGVEPSDEDRRAAAFAHARERLIRAYLPDEAALEALATARAQAAGAALVEAGVDGARIEAGAARLVDDGADGERVRTTLRLR